MNNHGRTPTLWRVTVILSAHRRAHFNVVALTGVEAIHMVMQSRPKFVGKQCEVREVEGGVAVAS